MIKKRKILKSNLNCILISFFVLLIVSCNNQNNKRDKYKSFKVDGITNLKLDTIQLVPSKYLTRDFFDSLAVKNYSKTQVVNGKFKFSGHFEYPHMLTFLTTNPLSFSEPIFIQDESIKLRIDERANGKVEFKSKIPDLQKEYYSIVGDSNWLKSTQEITRAYNKEKRDAAVAKKDSLLVSKLEKNSDSYIILWMLIDSFCQNGFNKYHLQSLDLFSAKIRRTKPYLRFKEKLELYNGGFSFSKIEMLVKDLELKSKILVFSDFQQHRFILVDFWYSYCGPCLQEMPRYIPIYRKFKNKGFEIVSISSDKSDDIKNWKKVIREHEFDWKNYLDENGQETLRLNVSRYPTTFLIDSRSGDILMKDVDPYTLNEFLENNLK